MKHARPLPRLVVKVSKLVGKRANSLSKAARMRRAAGYKGYIVFPTTRHFTQLSAARKYAKSEVARVGWARIENEVTGKVIADLRSNSRIPAKRKINRKRTTKRKNRKRS